MGTLMATKQLVEKTFNLIITDAPPSGTFGVSPSHVKKGQTFTLWWDTTGADSVVLDGGPFHHTPVASVGAYTLVSDGSTVYKLFASNDGGVLALTTEIIVDADEPEPPPPPPPLEGAVTYDMNTSTQYTAVVVGDDPGALGFDIEPYGGYPGRFFPPVTITAVSEGNWSNPLTWDLGRIPQAGDVVRVPAALVFANDRNTMMVTQLLAVNHGATLEADYNNNFTCEIIYPDVAINSSLDPNEWGNGFIGLGTTHICGKTRLRKVQPVSEPLTGHTSITLAASAAGWTVGDVLLFPDTRQFYWQISPGNPYADKSQQWEERTITAISGDGLTITLNAALQFDHKGARDIDNVLTFKPWIANITSNVLMRSANKDGTRGHMAIPHRAHFEICNIRIQDMGRTTNEVHSSTNKKGRYAVHFHHLIGPERTPAEQANPLIYQYEFTENVVYNYMPADVTKLPRGAIIIHDSHYGLIQNNVVYNCSGAGIVTETGPESYNLIDNNYVCNIAFSGNSENLRGSADSWHTGTAYWFMGVNNYITNNVTCGATKGYVFWPYGLFEDQPIPLEKGGDPHHDFELVNMRAIPVPEFSDNEAGGTMGAGFEPWLVGDAIPTPSTPGTIIQNFKAWHCGPIVYMYTVRNMIFNNMIARGDLANLAVGAGAGDGIFVSDYRDNGSEFNDCNMQGFTTGYVVGPEGDVTLTNCYFCNYINVHFRPIFQQGLDATLQASRTITFTNCVFDQATVGNLGGYPARSNFYMQGNYISRNTNLIVPDYCYVYSYQGVPGDDFRIYYPESEPDAILTQTEMQGGKTTILGSPEANKTNQYNWDTYGISFAGVVTPADATTREFIIGKVKDI